MGPYPVFGMIVLFVGIIVFFGCVVRVNMHDCADLFVTFALQNAKRPISGPLASSYSRFG